MRCQFEMTEEQFEKLLDASKPTLCMMIGNVLPRTPQQNANYAWALLGEEMGFDSLTVKPVPGKSGQHFTAEVRSCLVCGAPLIEPGGCAGTGMCGPCCTGDASTVGEY